MPATPAFHPRAAAVRAPSAAGGTRRSPPRQGPARRGPLRWAVALVGAVTLLLGAGGCLGQTGGGKVPAGSAVVQIYHMAFRPEVVTVRVGQPVTWKFEDQQVVHNVDSLTGAFLSPNKDTGTWTHVFTTPGTYHYICGIHRYMHGEVVVVPAGTTTTTAG